MVELLSRRYLPLLLICVIPRKDGKFLPFPFMHVYFYHKTVMGKITKFPKPAPVSRKVLRDLNERASLPESQGDDTRATDPWLKHHFLIHLPASRSPFPCAPPADPLSADLTTPANPQLGTCLI